jgi:NADPH:quinone reductase-like Zn-dependent oxidoreductase
MKGKYNVKLNYPYTPGWEGSGIVVSAGGSEESIKLVGKRVAFMKSSEIGSYKIGGAFAEYCVTDVGLCIAISDDLSLE